MRRLVSRLRGNGRLAAVAGLAAGVAWTTSLAGQQQIQVPDGYPALGQPPVVRLLSAGAEPRRTLRLRLTEGEVSRTEILMQMGMTGEMQGMALPVPAIPGMRMVAETRVTDVADDGTYSHETTFVEASLDSNSGTDPDMAAAMGEVLESIKGIRSTGRITNRAIPLEVNIESSGVTDPQLRQALGRAGKMEQIVFPLPEEPVGVGARWETLAAVTEDAMTLFQRFEVEVTDIADDRVTMAMKLEQTAPSQNIAAPGLPPEVEAWIESFKGTGSGTATSMLTALTGDGAMNLTVDMLMGAGIAGTPQTMNMRMRMQMSIQVKQAPPGGGGGD